MISTKIDFTSALIDAELRIGTLERTLEVLLAKSPMPNGQPVVSSEDIRRIQESVIANLKLKYPGAGIELSQTRLRVKPAGIGGHGASHDLAKAREQARGSTQIWALYEYK